jgi:hypothetical protein
MYRIKRGNIRNFLAQLRIPMRACNRNIQPKDTVHKEHRNADPWPGKKIFSFARLDLITKKNKCCSSQMTKTQT